MELATRTAKTNNQPTSTAYMPYTETTYGRLSKTLAKHNIRSVALPPRKIFSYLLQVKNALGLRTPSIYRIPCECGRVYIGQSGQSIQIRINEHNRHIRLTHIIFLSRSFNYFRYMKLPSDMPAIPICLSLLLSNWLPFLTRLVFKLVSGFSSTRLSGLTRIYELSSTSKTVTGTRRLRSVFLPLFGI